MKRFLQIFWIVALAAGCIVYIVSRGHATAGEPAPTSAVFEPPSANPDAVLPAFAVGVTALPTEYVLPQTLPPTPTPTPTPTELVKIAVPRLAPTPSPLPLIAPNRGF